MSAIVDYYCRKLSDVDSVHSTSSQSTRRHVAQLREAAYDTVSELYRLCKKEGLALAEKFSSIIQSGLRGPAIRDRLLALSHAQENCNLEEATIESLMKVLDPTHPIEEKDICLLNRYGKESTGALRDLLNYWSRDNAFRQAIRSAPVEKELKKFVDTEFSGWDYDARTVKPVPPVKDEFADWDYCSPEMAKVLGTLRR